MVGGLRSLRLIPGTLRARLVLASAASILVVLAVLTAVTIVLVGTELRSSLDTALRERAQEVAQLAISAPAVLSEPGALESPVSGRQLAVEVIDRRGRILARSLTLGARLLPQDGLVRSARVAGATGFEDLDLGDRRFRLYAAPIAQAGGPAAGGAVLVASETSDIETTIHHLGFLLTLTGTGAALLAALLAAGLVRRGLTPLRRLIGAAEAIERTGDPARRLPPSADSASAPPAHEIAQLTGVLNRMLDSLERSRASERRFLADASHELRTPVTTLLGNVEYAARHGADAEVLDDLQRDATRLARLVDDLLALEREGGAASGLEPVRLDRLVEDVLGELGQARTRIDLAALPAVKVRAEAEGLRRALRNLIDNALAHGPPEGPVQIELSEAGGTIRLSVADEGPGPDPAQRERLFERFWRGEGAAGRPGSGLGLSIVAAIVQRHGGRVSVDGSTFSIQLPAAPPSRDGPQDSE
jgi:two-component system sensor histidine kinase MprB